MSALEEDAGPKASSDAGEDAPTTVAEVVKEETASVDEATRTASAEAEADGSPKKATATEVVVREDNQVKEETTAKDESCRDQSILNLKELPRTGKRGAPQAFPHLLFLMLEREPKEVIQWTEEGRAFMISDLSAFIATTLVKYFRHSRYASFQRQLNLYGFRKNESGAFEHKYFVRTMPELLTRVQRSPQPSKTGTRTKKSIEAEQHHHHLHHHHQMSMQRKYELPTLKNVSSARKPTAATSTKRNAAAMYDPHQPLLRRGVAPSSSSDGYMVLNDRGDPEIGSGDHYNSNKRNRYMMAQQQQQHVHQETLWRMVEPGKYEPVTRGGPVPMQYMPNGSVGPGIPANVASQYDYYNVVVDGDQDAMQNGGYVMVPQQKHHPDLAGRAGIVPKNTNAGGIKRSAKSIQRVTEKPPSMSDEEWAVHQYANESENAAEDEYRQTRQDGYSGDSFQGGMRMMAPWLQPGSATPREYSRVERTNSMPNLGGYHHGAHAAGNYASSSQIRRWGNNNSGSSEDVQGWGQPRQGVDRPFSLVGAAGGSATGGNNQPSKTQQGAKKRKDNVGPIALNDEKDAEDPQNAYSDANALRQQEYMSSGLTPTNGTLAGFSPTTANEAFFSSPNSAALYGSSFNFEDDGRGTAGSAFSFTPQRGGAAAMRATAQQQHMAYQQQSYYPSPPGSSSRGPFQFPTNRGQQHGAMVGANRNDPKARRGPMKRDDSETMAAAAAEEAHNTSSSEMMMMHAAAARGGGDGGSHVTFAAGVAQSPASAAYHRQRSFNRNTSEDEAILLNRTMSISSEDWTRGLDETSEVVNTLANIGRTTSVQSDQYERQGPPSSALYEDRHQEMDDFFEGNHSSLDQPSPLPHHPTFSYGQTETA